MLVIDATLRPQFYPSVERTDFEAFKPGHAVGFGPQANFAGGARKPPVGRDKKLPAVEKYREAFVSRRDAKSVPCLTRHIDLHTFDHLSLSGDDTIKANVIFECAGAGDVIIINRCKSDEYARGLIGFAGNCHEADRNVNIASGERPVDSKRKAIVSRIGIYLCQCSTGVALNDRLFARFTVARGRKLEIVKPF